MKHDEHMVTDFGTVVLVVTLVVAVGCLIVIWKFCK